MSLEWLPLYTLWCKRVVYFPLIQSEKTDSRSLDLEGQKLRNKNVMYLFTFVETPRKFIIAELSTDEDPSLRIESSAIINLRGVSTKLNKCIVFTIQTYKKLKNVMIDAVESFLEINETDP